VNGGGLVTIVGSGFGVAADPVTASICSDAAVHVPGAEDTRVTCTLRPGRGAGDNIANTVYAIGGSTTIASSVNYRKCGNPLSAINRCLVNTIHTATVSHTPTGIHGRKATLAASIEVQMYNTNRCFDNYFVVLPGQGNSCFCCYDP
jgi:hypothetical protein